MAKSTGKTTTAILRGVLGPVYGREDQFAELAQRSVSWVKKVSAGREPLTEDAARVLSSETGISLTWLLAGDPKASPVDSLGQPYDELVFQRHRVKLGKGRLEVRTAFDLADAVAEIAGIFSAAAQQGHVALFHWRLTEFIRTSRAEFGHDDHLHGRVQRKLAKAEMPRLIFTDDFVDSVGFTVPGVESKPPRRRRA